MSFVTESVALTKIEGNYAGHYVSDHLGKDTLSFDITHDTHTGHFVGTYIINTNSLGTLTGSAKGVIHVNKHVDVTLSGKLHGTSFTGTFIGTASHTGGSFAGSYEISGGGVSDSGTYHVGKS